MDFSIYIAILALIIALFSLFRSHQTTKILNADSIANLRRQVFLKALEVELEWQTILNELHQFNLNTSPSKSGETQLKQVTAYLDGLKQAFNLSFQHAKDIRQAIEEDLDGISREQAQKYLADFEKGQAELKSTKEQMVKKLNALAENLATRK